MDSVQNDFHGKDINLITVGMSFAVDISLDTYRSEGRPVRRKLVSRCSTPAGSRVPHYKKNKRKYRPCYLITISGGQFYGCFWQFK
jgi:hypothetical protein